LFVSSDVFKRTARVRRQTRFSHERNVWDIKRISAYAGPKENTRSALDFIFQQPRAFATGRCTRKQQHDNFFSALSAKKVRELPSFSKFEMLPGAFAALLTAIRVRYGAVWAPGSL